jgi:hypothetical protein
MTSSNQTFGKWNLLSHKNKINLNEKLHILQEEKKGYGLQLRIQ